MRDVLDVMPTMRSQEARVHGFEETDEFVVAVFNDQEQPLVEGEVQPFESDGERTPIGEDLRDVLFK